MQLQIRYAELRSAPRKRAEASLQYKQVEEQLPQRLLQLPATGLRHAPILPWQQQQQQVIPGPYGRQRAVI
jgi:hypothetical protein